MAGVLGRHGRDLAPSHDERSQVSPLGLGQAAAS